MELPPTNHRAGLFRDFLFLLCFLVKRSQYDGALNGAAAVATAIVAAAATPAENSATAAADPRCGG